MTDEKNLKISKITALYTVVGNVEYYIILLCIFKYCPSFPYNIIGRNKYLH